MNKLKMLIKRIRCKHKHVEHIGSYLVKEQGNEWRTAHKWRCKDCGKIL